MMIKQTVKKTIFTVAAVFLLVTLSLIAAACSKKPPAAEPERPVFSFQGIKDIYVAESVEIYNFLSGVSVVDKDGNAFVPACDSAAVKFGTSGVYTIVYSYLDIRAEAKVYILSQPIIVIDDSHGFSFDYTEAEERIKTMAVAKDSFGNSLDCSAAGDIYNDDGSLRMGEIEITYVAYDAVGTLVTANVTVTVTENAEAPILNEGKITVDVIDTQASLTAELNGAYVDFISVNGIVANSLVVTGNIIEFDTGVLNQLNVGEHLLRLVTKFGYAEAIIDIVDNELPVIDSEGLDNWIYKVGVSGVLPSAVKKFPRQAFEIKYTLEDPSGQAANIGSGHSFVPGGEGIYRLNISYVKDGGQPVTDSTHELSVLSESDYAKIGFAGWSKQFAASVSPVGAVNAAFTSKALGGKSGAWEIKSTANPAGKEPRNNYAMLLQGMTSTYAVMEVYVPVGNSFSFQTDDYVTAASYFDADGKYLPRAPHDQWFYAAAPIFPGSTSADCLYMTNPGAEGNTYYLRSVRYTETEPPKGPHNSYNNRVKVDFIDNEPIGGITGDIYQATSNNAGNKPVYGDATYEIYSDKKSNEYMKLDLFIPEGMPKDVFDFWSSSGDLRPAQGIYYIDGEIIDYIPIAQWFTVYLPLYEKGATFKLGMNETAAVGDSYYFKNIEQTASMLTNDGFFHAYQKTVTVSYFSDYIQQSDVYRVTRKVIDNAPVYERPVFQISFEAQRCVRLKLYFPVGMDSEVFDIATALGGLAPAYAQYFVDGFAITYDSLPTGKWIDVYVPLYGAGDTFFLGVGASTAVDSHYYVKYLGDIAVSEMPEYIPFFRPAGTSVENIGLFEGQENAVKITVLEDKTGLASYQIKVFNHQKALDYVASFMLYVPTGGAFSCGNGTGSAESAVKYFKLDGQPLGGYIYGQWIRGYMQVYSAGGEFFLSANLAEGQSYYVKNLIFTVDGTIPQHNIITPRTTETVSAGFVREGHDGLAEHVFSVTTKAAGVSALPYSTESTIAVNASKMYAAVNVWIGAGATLSMHSENSTGWTTSNSKFYNMAGVSIQDEVIANGLPTEQWITIYHITYGTKGYWLSNTGAEGSVIYLQNFRFEADYAFEPLVSSLESLEEFNGLATQNNGVSTLNTNPNYITDGEGSIKITVGEPLDLRFDFGQWSELFGRKIAFDIYIEVLPGETSEWAHLYNGWGAKWLTADGEQNLVYGEWLTIEITLSDNTQRADLRDGKSHGAGSGFDTGSIPSGAILYIDNIRICPYV